MEQKILLMSEMDTYEYEKYLEEGWVIKQITGTLTTETYGPMGGRCDEARPACYILLEREKK